MWPVESTREVYGNRWIRVDEDVVDLPGGGSGIYGVVTVRHPSVFVVAVTDADEVVLVQVDRHTTGPGWEVPAGGTDGDDPLDAARRELREETGLAASEWVEVGRMNALNGICRAPEHVFLARGLSRVGGDEQAAEGIACVESRPWSEVLAMVRGGEIDDGETVAALMYAALHLGRVH